MKNRERFTENAMWCVQILETENPKESSDLRRVGASDKCFGFMSK